MILSLRKSKRGWKSQIEEHQIKVHRRIYFAFNFFNLREMSNPQPTTETVASPELKFADISKLFSLPIADAATKLGVCSSVLKRMCRENGLVRWPYRKYLAGKSVEEIQRDAAREKKRELFELTRAARQRNDPSAGFGSSVYGDHCQTVMQQSSYSKSIPGYLDEFRHGFPSGGLSTDMVRWWGDIGEDEMFEEEPTDDQVNEQQCHRDEGKSLEDEKQDTGSEKTEVGVQGVALLSSLRKRAANEGREGLQIGVCSRRKTFKIGEKEKLLLLKVLKTSLPSQLML